MLKGRGYWWGCNIEPKGEKGNIETVGPSGRKVTQAMFALKLRQVSKVYKYLRDKAMESLT